MMNECNTHLMTFLGTGNYQSVWYQWLDGQPARRNCSPRRLRVFCRRSARRRLSLPRNRRPNTRQA